MNEVDRPRSLAEPVEIAGPADLLLEACLPVPHAHREGDARTAAELLVADPSAARANVWVAAATGELDRVRELLGADAARANRRGGTRNWEPLLYLCFSRLLPVGDARADRMVEAARLLLESGADPNCYWVDPNEGFGNRETPIYGAAGIANRVDLVALLLEHGADPNDGETAYHMVEHARVPAAQLIFPLLEPIHRGAALGHHLDYDDLPGLRRLLEAGGDPNGPTPFPNFPIHQAVWRGRTRPFFDLLVEYGADVNLPNRHGRTAYALAARAGQRDTMGWLVALGAHTDLQPPDDFLAACALGDTPAASAMIEARPELMESLSAVDRAVICEAAAAGNVIGLGTMLELGWDVNTRGNVWGETPLHRAAMAGEAEAAEFLLASGADPTLRDRSYDSPPAGWATHGGHEALAARLSAKG